MDVVLSIEEGNRELFKDLLGHDKVALGETIELPGGAKLINLTGGALGIDEIEVVKFLLENVHNIAVDIFAAYLYDKLKGYRAKLLLDEKQVPVEKEAIVSTLEKIKTEIEERDSHGDSGREA